MNGTWVRHKSDDTNIVFIHGINSSEKCWKHENGTYWPDLLKESLEAIAKPELSQAGIYVYNYQTDIFSGTYRVGDVVTDLKERLKLNKIFKTKRLILVCHSMGGIVARRLLVQRARDFESLQIGLFLIASPSLGSRYAKFVTGLAKLINFRQPDILRFSQNNAWLNDLDTDFINLKESEQLELIGKELIEDKFIRYQTINIFRQVVEPFSGARYFGEAVRIPNSDHFTISTPVDEESFQHQLLVQFIVTAVSENSGLSVQKL